MMITVYIENTESIELAASEILIKLKAYLCPNITSWAQKLLDISRILIAFLDVSREEDKISDCDILFSQHIKI